MGGAHTGPCCGCGLYNSVMYILNMQQWQLTSKINILCIYLVFFTGHITCSFFAHKYICWPYTNIHILKVTNNNNLSYNHFHTQTWHHKQEMFYCFLSLWEAMGEEFAVGCWVSRIRSFMSAGTKENTMTSWFYSCSRFPVVLQSGNLGMRLYQKLFSCLTMTLT